MQDFKQFKKYYEALFDDISSRDGASDGTKPTKQYFVPRYLADLKTAYLCTLGHKRTSTKSYREDNKLYEYFHSHTSDVCNFYRTAYMNRKKTVSGRNTVHRLLNHKYFAELLFENNFRFNYVEKIKQIIALLPCDFVIDTTSMEHILTDVANGIVKRGVHASMLIILQYITHRCQITPIMNDILSLQNKTTHRLSSHPTRTLHLHPLPLILRRRRHLPLRGQQLLRNLPR